MEYRIEPLESKDICTLILDKAIVHNYATDDIRTMVENFFKTCNTKPVDSLITRNWIDNECKNDIVQYWKFKADFEYNNTGYTLSVVDSVYSIYLKVYKNDKTVLILERIK
jgi:hypothetical protein